MLVMAGTEIIPRTMGIRRCGEWTANWVLARVAHARANGSFPRVKPRRSAIVFWFTPEKRIEKKLSPSGTLTSAK